MASTGRDRSRDPSSSRREREGIATDWQASRSTKRDALMPARTRKITRPARPRIPTAADLVVDLGHDAGVDPVRSSPVVGVRVGRRAGTQLVPLKAHPRPTDWVEAEFPPGSPPHRNESGHPRGLRRITVRGLTQRREDGRTRAEPRRAGRRSDAVTSPSRLACGWRSVGSSAAGVRLRSPAGKSTTSLDVYPFHSCTHRFDPSFAAVASSPSTAPLRAPRPSAPASTC